MIIASMVQQMTLFEADATTPPLKSANAFPQIEWSHSRRDLFERCQFWYYLSYYGAGKGTAKSETRKEQLRFLKKLDVDFHKNSVKGIRLWDRGRSGEVRHCLEGTTLLLDDRTVVLVNTGAATLTQGSAEPIMLIGRSDSIDMKAVAEYVHATSQLNWSSPRVAQRLPLPLKRTDDELKNRAAQEIRRTK